MKVLVLLFFFVSATFCCHNDPTPLFSGAQYFSYPSGLSENAHSWKVQIKRLSVRIDTFPYTGEPPTQDGHVTRTENDSIFATSKDANYNLSVSCEIQIQNIKGFQAYTSYPTAPKDSLLMVSLSDSVYRMIGAPVISFCLSYSEVDSITPTPDCWDTIWTWVNIITPFMFAAVDPPGSVRFSKEAGQTSHILKSSTRYDLKGRPVYSVDNYKATRLYFFKQ